MSRSSLLWFVLTLLAIALVTAFAPLEKTLGSNIRIVYLHGAWVWTAMLAFALAAITGLGGLIIHRSALYKWSRALGRTGLCFWITFLPMSLYVMQANWSGLFLDEPRFRVPLNYAIIGLLVQIGLSFFPDLRWTALANLLFGTVLFYSMGQVQTVLHPDSPILNSNSRDIQLFFLGLLLLLCAAAWQLALWWQSREGNQLEVHK